MVPTGLPTQSGGRVLYSRHFPGGYPSSRLHYKQLDKHYNLTGTTVNILYKGWEYTHTHTYKPNSMLRGNSAGLLTAESVQGTGRVPCKPGGFCWSCYTMLIIIILITMVQVTMVTMEIIVITLRRSLCSPGQNGVHTHSPTYLAGQTWCSRWKGKHTEFITLQSKIQIF